MSRNELRVIARIMLIGVGLYVVLQTFLTILSSLAAMPLVASAKADVPIIIIALVIYIVITLAVVYFLFRYTNRFSAKIVEYEPVDDAQIAQILLQQPPGLVRQVHHLLFVTAPHCAFPLAMTKAEFFEPKPMQLHTATSTDFAMPRFGI